MAKKKTKTDLTKTQITEAKTLAAIGFTLDQIAEYLSISTSTLDRRINDQEGLRDALREGRTKSAAKVYNAAYEMATSKKQPAFTQFYLRTRYKWQEKREIELKIHKEVDAKEAFMEKLKGMDEEELKQFVEDRKKNLSPDVS